MRGGENRARRYAFILIIPLVLFLSFSLNSCSRLYVLSVKEYPTIEGGFAWVLDYSVNGVVSSAIFDTREELVKYYVWLKRGKIEKGANP